jgi:hypothetical protein
MLLVLLFLILFYVVAFVYDKIIDLEIKRSPTLHSRLIELKYFNSLQARPKALSALLRFQFKGVSTPLTVIGSLFSVLMYLGIIGGLYLLSR